MCVVYIFIYLFIYFFIYLFFLFGAECLEYTYNSPETLEGDNKYQCDCCKQRVNATKEYVIAALPAPVRSLVLFYSSSMNSFEHLCEFDFDFDFV